jgi:glycosyltransferase involved in cell wall biosynthesis
VIPVGGREYLRERALVRQLLTDIRPDVVHTHGYRTDVLHGSVARSLKIPVVTTVHGFTGGGWKNRFYESLQIGAFRRADAVVVVSHPLRARLNSRRVPDQKIHCIPNAWADPIPFLDRHEARAELGIPDNVWCAGFIGRLGREKGPDIFADAIGKLKSSGPGEISGLMIGGGVMQAEIAALPVASGPEATLRLAGAIEDAGRLIRAFDALVLSSRTEGTPMVLFEAMAAGVPIVATRVGGIPDVVTPNEAVLVPPEDSVELSEALRQVRDHPGKASERANRAAERLATAYGADRWREAYDSVYRRVVQERHP